MVQEMLLGKAALNEARERITHLTGFSPAVCHFASEVGKELHPDIVSGGFYGIARRVMGRLYREGSIGPDDSLSAALLQDSIYHLGRALLPAEFIGQIFYKEQDPQYAQGEWKGYVCFNDDGKNALQNVSRRAFDIATVHGIQLAHYEGGLDSEKRSELDKDYERCKKLGFEKEVLDQLEILVKIDPGKFPISFARAQDPRVQSAITAYTPRRFIPVEELAG